MFARPCVTSRLLPAVVVWLLSWGSGAVWAQTTQFTYQGLLNDAGSPANGTYDLQFKLYDAVSGGAQISSTFTAEDVAVSNGLFKVTLDFGAAAFPGAARWLEIGVRPGASTGAFTTLSPRQPLSSTPYAIRSLSAATATQADGLSVACVNCVTSSQIATVAGNQVSGAIPVASVPAGSANYVQNTTTPQASAHFNISGNGMAGGTLSASLVNAATQFNLGGNRVLSAPGDANLFVGLQAGTANTTGSWNSFFGPGAGQMNTTGFNLSIFGSSAGVANTVGVENSFFGALAGNANTEGGYNSFFGSVAGRANLTGSSNSFFGAQTGFSNTTGNGNAFFGGSAGSSNTLGSQNGFFGTNAGVNNTTGGSNAFIGDGAGTTNTTGSNNTLLGKSANVGANNLTNATALGYRANVAQSNSLVLGSINGVNGASADTKVGIGTTAPAERLHIVGNLKITGQAASGAPNGIIFNDGSFLGTATNLGTVTSVTASEPLNSSGGLTPNISLLGVVPVANGGTNLSSAGTVGNYLRSNGLGWTSAPLLAADLPSGSGHYIQNGTAPQASANFSVSGNGTAAIFNATAQFNLNSQRILSNPGTDNLFLGIHAGEGLTTGRENTFLGHGAGGSNTTGERNTSVGFGAGGYGTTSSYNAFFGTGSGAGNTGDNNAFFGTFTANGFASGSNNSLFGFSAGFNLTSGFRNVFVGTGAGTAVTTGSDNVYVGYYANGTHPETGNHNTALGSEAQHAQGLSYATAIGAGAIVSTSNTIQLGRSGGTETVRIPGKLVISTLGTSSSTHLCLNASFEVSSCSSSQRYKTQIHTFSAGLDLLQRLRPVTFHWKTSGERELGLIAEEVAAVDPLLVTHNPKGEIEGVKYDQLSVVLINAIQQQQAQLKQQQAQIQQQQVEIAALKQLVCLSHPQTAVCQPPQAKR